MKVFLTSDTGCSNKENGKRIPVPMSEANGFVHKLQKEWVDDSKVLLLQAHQMPMKKTMQFVRFVSDLSR